MGLGPGVQLCLIADCKPQTQEPSRHKNRIYRNIAPDASPNYRKSSEDHTCPVQDIVLSPAPNSLQGHIRLTVGGEHCAEETANVSRFYSAPSHLQEEFLSFWRCVRPWGGKKQERPSPLPLEPRAHPQSPFPEPPECAFPSKAPISLSVPTGTPEGQGPERRLLESQPPKQCRAGWGHENKWAPWATGMPYVIFFFIS